MYCYNTVLLQSTRLGDSQLTHPFAPRHYVVTLTSLTLQAPNSNPSSDFHISNTTTNTNNNNDLPVPVIVDSGTTLSLLPEPVVAALAAGFPGAAPDGSGGYTVPCALRDEPDARVLFGFRGDSAQDIMIAVRYSDFIWQADTDQCVLGASYAPGIGVWILGDTFLRGAYGELAFFSLSSFFLLFSISSAAECVGLYNSNRHCVKSESAQPS